MQTITAFSTESTPAARRPGFYRRQMEDLFSIGLDVEPTADEPFRTEVTAYRRSRLQFAALRFTPHTTRRAPRSTARAPQLLVTVNKEGETFVAQDGRESWIGQDEIVVIDPSRPFFIESGHILTYSVYLPAAAMRAVVPHVDSLTARTIDGRGGAGAVFRAIVDELCRQAPRLEVSEADDLADMLPHALAPALLALRGDEAVSASRLRLLHKHRIKRFARDNLWDAGLDAQAVASHLQLSTRYVYELFSDEPQPMMKWIWSERLECAYRELSAAPSGRTVGEVAYGWGFTNLTHFSRVFRARYGVSPSQARKAAGQG